jgi:hypothetical protein
MLEHGRGQFSSGILPTVYVNHLSRARGHVEVCRGGINGKYGERENFHSHNCHGDN